jgi:hypothetical protein
VTVLEECITEEQRFVVRFCGQKDPMKKIFIKKCLLFTVGSVCHVKNRLQLGSKRFVDDEEVQTEVQKWLSGRPLLDNGYDKSGVRIVVWVPIVNAFTQQRIYGQTFPAQGKCRFCYNGYTDPFDKVFSTRLAKGCLKEIQTQIETIKT